jgi:hypothetical protein
MLGKGRMEETRSERYREIRRGGLDGGLLVESEKKTRKNERREGLG